MSGANRLQKPVLLTVAGRPRAIEVQPRSNSLALNEQLLRP